MFTPLLAWRRFSFSLLGFLLAFVLSVQAQEAPGLSISNVHAHPYGNEQVARYPCKHAFVDGGFESKMADRFVIMGIPKPIPVGPNGQIVETEADLRGEVLLETLDEHLGSTTGVSVSEESN